MMKKKPHPIHSGDVHHHSHHHHHHKHHPSVAQEILHLLRGLESNALREGTIGFVLATLVHEDHIKSTYEPTLIANLAVNHYYPNVVETIKPVG